MGLIELATNPRYCSLFRYLVSLNPKKKKKNFLRKIQPSEKFPYSPDQACTWKRKGLQIFTCQRPRRWLRPFITNFDFFGFSFNNRLLADLSLAEDPSLADLRLSLSLLPFNPNEEILIDLILQSLSLSSSRASPCEILESVWSTNPESILSLLKSTASELPKGQGVGLASK